MKPPVLYIEDQNHDMPKVYLVEPVYAQAILAFVIVCTDAVIVNRANRTIYLAKRKTKPMQGLWLVGGRMFAGETETESIVRCFRRETSVEVAAERFQFVVMNRYRWADRQQFPQSAGSDNLAYTYCVELSDDELARVRSGLETGEYEEESLREYNRTELVEAKAHQALIDLYDLIFS